MRISRDYSLLAHNTFGIDVQCACFAEYDNADELRELLHAYMNNELPLPLLHIGSGANLLFVGDFAGTILHSAIRGFEVVEQTADTVLLRIGAGENWDDVVAHTLDCGYYGLENLSFIPSEVGAAAVQNIGAYGTEIEQFVERVEGVSIQGKTQTYTHEKCTYAYRSSLFKTLLKDRFFITHVYLRLSRQFVPNLSYAALRRLVEEAGLDENSVSAKDIRRLVVQFRSEKLPLPAETGSAGSFFINPVISSKAFQALQEAYPDIPHYDAPDGIKVPAGWLIDRAGWRGRCLGRAGVWSKQALVLVNLGGASGEEIVQLSQAIQADVYQKFGIRLNPEVNFV